jgi:hypothetical protein
VNGELSLRTEFIWSVLQIGAACGDNVADFSQA